jgi:uncharacterized protein YndB with AHSA1/START domain
MNSTNYHIYHDLQINTTAKKLFEAVSKPSELENWWPLKCSGEEKLQAEYNFNFTDAYDWYGKVTAYQPNSTFYIQMTKSNEDWNSTSFGFDIEEIDKNKVQLHFWHKNWQRCNAEFKQSSFCWAMLLNGLKNYVEKGIIIPFEDRE